MSSVWWKFSYYVVCVWLNLGAKILVNLLIHSNAFMHTTQYWYQNFRLGWFILSHNLYFIERRHISKIIMIKNVWFWHVNYFYCSWLYTQLLYYVRLFVILIIQVTLMDMLLQYIEWTSRQLYSNQTLRAYRSHINHGRKLGNVAHVH